MPFLLETKKSIWLGGKRDSSGDFQWVSGGNFKYENWQPSEPNNEHGVENCTVLSPNMMNKWNDRMCDVEKRFICEKQLITGNLNKLDEQYQNHFSV